jgi:hypothetical protein
MKFATLEIHFGNCRGSYNFHSLICLGKNEKGAAIPRRILKVGGKNAFEKI